MVNSLTIKSTKDLHNFPVDKINWGDVSTHLSWSAEDIREWKDYIDWNSLIFNFNSEIDLDIIREFKDTFDELEKKKLDPDNIRYWDSTWGMILWRKIIGDTTATEFIDRFEKFDVDILRHQNFLSEKFIERFDYMLDWHDIKNYEHVSKEFKQKYKKKIEERKNARKRI